MTTKGNKVLIAELRQMTEKFIELGEVNEKLRATISFYKNKESKLTQSSFWKAFKEFRKLRK